MSDDLPRLLPIARVCEVLDIKPPRAYELIRLNVLPAVRLNRHLRVDEAALREFIDRGGRMLPRRRTRREARA